MMAGFPDAAQAPSALSLDPAVVARIRDVPHLREGSYRDLDVGMTLDFFRKRYVDQIGKFRTVDSNTVIADIGAGYGWLAMTFALLTPAKVIAVELDGPRLEAGRQVAEILGIADRIEWHVGALGTLPLPDRCADIVYCIEVLEHVGGDDAAVRDLARISRDIVILTTPNLWFPVIAHDTELPFCHWLPMSLRQHYAKLFKRTDKENNNIFWSPRKVRELMPGYRVASGFLHYRSLEDYLGTFPFQLPYIGRGKVEGPGRLQGLYYRLASLLGNSSTFVLPNLACVFRRTGPA